MQQPAVTNNDIPNWCGATPGRMPGFVQPCLLLLLAQQPAHGYQLLERLHQQPDTEGIDPGFFDAREVLEHAHAVLAAVAGIEPPQPRTRECLALEAEAGRVFLHRLAVADDA